MKSILDLDKILKDEDYFNSQIDINHPDTNILYVSPYKSSKGLYKYLIPSILMNNDGIAICSLTGIEKHDENRQYIEIDTPITPKQIDWADIIIFPFTTQPLWTDNTEESLYDSIRRRNPNIKIIYNVDFNFYLLPKDNSNFEVFDKNTVRHVEDNIFYSDLTLSSNMLLVDFLNDKLQQLKKTRYKGISSPARISSFPILIDEPLFMENVLQNEPTKLPPTENDHLRIGIIANTNSFEDIKSYAKELEAAKKKLGQKLEIIIMGFNAISDKTGKPAFSKDFEFTYIKPCTIIHWMRQLDMMTLDAIFIPLRLTEYNYTSEDYNKVLEAGILRIPVIAPNIFPYNEVIENGKTGIILEKKSDLAPLIEAMGMKKSQFAKMGENLYNFVVTSLSCHPKNLIVIKGIYSGLDVKKYLHNQVEEQAIRQKDEDLIASKTQAEQDQLEKSNAAIKASMAAKKATPLTPVAAPKAVKPPSKAKTPKKAPSVKKAKTNNKK